MAHDALGAHARDELGLADTSSARPVVAAMASAAAFAGGAILPVVAALVAPTALVSWAVALASLLLLATLGVLGAVAGGADPARGALRVAFWGALAMAATAGTGALFGTRV